MIKSRPSVRDKGLDRLPGNTILAGFFISLLCMMVLPVEAKTSSWLRGSIDRDKSDKTLADPAYAAFEAGNYLSAMKEAKKAANRGEPQAFTLIARLHEEGLGVPQDYKKAAENYKKGAELGDINAKYSYGLLLAQGKGVGKDLTAARTLLEAAAKTGHTNAQYNLALVYAKGLDGGADTEQAAYWFLKAGQTGHTRAQYDLGTLYAIGSGITKSDKKAADWIGRAAHAGLPDAMLDYAIILFKGRGIKKDKAAATGYFKQAAEKGNKVAQNRLARLYAWGLNDGIRIIVERDYVQAAKWHLISRKAGVSDARLDLFLASLKKDERAQAEQAAEDWRVNAALR